MGRPKAGVTNEQRFWSHVTKTAGCWIWTGFTNKLGYGRPRWNGPQILAHRVSWELLVGPIPAGLCVLHKCDNPPCVNPEHLYIGTKLDNSRDMTERGRHRHRGLRGELSPDAKLTNDEAALIRRVRPRGQAVLAMAEAFGVDAATIYRIRRGRTYR